MKRIFFFIILSFALCFSAMQPAFVHAEEKRLMKDESIYDLLIDRFFNGDAMNDEGVNTRDMQAFSGGDFAGIIKKANYIHELGFTLASIGSPFQTARYDGNKVISYDDFDPHFGTKAQFIEMIEKLNALHIGTIVDFPLNGISDEHIWIKEDGLKTVPTENGIQWDGADGLVQEKLTEAILDFVKKYDQLAGIRLTYLGDFDDSFLQNIITEIKEANDSLYVLTNEPSNAAFDLKPNVEAMNGLKQSYVQADPDSSPLNLFEDGNEEQLIQLDDLKGSRFTEEIVALQKFPPTRWKLATTALFTLPGVPVLTYESENAVTGAKAPESHPIVNFKTDPDLYEHIAALNKVRNQSETLRNGKFEMLHNEDGFTVYRKMSDEEMWIIAINNTSKTASFELSSEQVGDDKRFRGLLQNDQIIQGKDGKYRIVLERELPEIYFVEEDKGFNTPYLIVTILVYSSFFVLLFMLFRRSKKNDSQA